MRNAVKTSVGAVEVAVLTDGVSSFGPELFPGTESAHIEDLLGRQSESEIRTNFNAVLIRSGDRTVLADAGPRDLFGPACGKLNEGMQEVGVKPEDVDTLFATHLHPDHVAGMVTSDGKAAFSNAELVVMRADHDFWSGEISGANEMVQQWQQLAKAVLAAYGDRLRLIDGEAEIVPGMTALPLPGHTPGHAGFRLSSGGEQLVHVGDIVHAPMVQLADPQIAIAFDIDPETARDTRKRLLDQMASEGALITGGHLLQPALGRIVRENGGYGLVRD